MSRDEVGECRGRGSIKGRGGGLVRRKGKVKKRGDEMEQREMGGRVVYSYWLIYTFPSRQWSRDPANRQRCAVWNLGKTALLACRARSTLQVARRDWRRIRQSETIEGPASIQRLFYIQSSHLLTKLVAAHTWSSL